MYGAFRIRHIAVGSAFKVGAVTGGILSAIVLIPMGLLIALGVLSSKEGSIMVGGALMGLATVLCGPLIYAVIYGLATALSALIYNVVAGVTGGLEVSLERPNTGSHHLPTAEQILGTGE